MTEFIGLIGSHSVEQLEEAVQALATTRWNSLHAHYLTYREGEPFLARGAEHHDLTPENQPGACALTFQPVTDQALPWPEGLANGGNHRVSLPLSHQGSLNGVLCLDFTRAPNSEVSADISRLADLLGVVGAQVQEREARDAFIERCQRLLVRAVEVHGHSDHVTRCARLANALATMLDFSPQVKGELQLAAQYHDIALLEFAEPDSFEARRDHALKGARVLELHPQLRSVAHLVEGHHERYDGSGLPHGRQGHDLALEGWVMALTEDLVETWETTEGDYETRVRAFFNDSAKHHHPDVVDALCGLVDSGQLRELLGEL